jgi:hypothetical protein
MPQKGVVRIGFHERKRGQKPGEKIFGNDEQTVYERRALTADEKFQMLLMANHKNRFGLVTTPGTERPRFAPANPSLVRTKSSMAEF